MSVRSLLKPALLASALGTLLAAAPASAQDNGRYNNAAFSNDSESITVTAPRFHENRDPKGALQNLSLSRAVPYDDLDLRTRDGARELRARVREAARDVCDQLDDASDDPQATGTSCYRTALESGMSHAEFAIRDARQD